MVGARIPPWSGNTVPALRLILVTLGTIILLPYFTFFFTLQTMPSEGADAALKSVTCPLIVAITFEFAI